MQCTAEEERLEKNEVFDDIFLDALFSYLNHGGIVNLTSAGYFCKIVDSLIDKRLNDVIEGVNYG